MSVNPNQGKGSEQYGGYQGYTPPVQPSDPYSSQQYGQQGDYQQPNTAYPYGQQQQQEQEQVQYNTYQPPLAGRTASKRGRQSNVFGTTSETSTGLAAKWAAPLSYLFWWISGLVLLVVERKNRLVRFSAAQSVALLAPAAIVLGVLHFLGGLFSGVIILETIFGVVFGFLLFYIVAIPVVLVWLFLMFQAYRGVSVRLPFFSTIADRILSIFGGPGSV